MIRTTLFALFCATALLIPAPSRAATCQAEILPALQALDRQIAAIRRTLPSAGSGAQVNVGSCASRLRKLYGNELCCTTFANWAVGWEEISCLELKKNYLRKTCECGQKNLTFSTDEILQDQSMETLAAITRLDREARRRGIRNPVIRALVNEAARVRDCFSIGTLETLRQTEQALDRALAVQ